MFILIRVISNYTNANLLLGVFTTEHLAEEARNKYIAPLKLDPDSDPWKLQGYRDSWSLTEDVQILSDVSAEITTTLLEIVHVVSLFEEAFGQIQRASINIFQTEEDALKFKMKMEEKPDVHFSTWAEIEELVVNQLRVNDKQY